MELFFNTPSDAVRITYSAVRFVPFVRVTVT